MQRDDPRIGRWLLFIVVAVGLVVGVSASLRGPPIRKPFLVPSITATRDLWYHPSAQLDVYGMEDPGRHPVMVMLHGCCGGREDLFQLAFEFASRGVLVFNAGWTPIPAGGRYPEVYQHAACAVRYARSTAEQFGGDGSFVAVLGFSDGALLGATTMLASNEFEGECPHSESGQPDLFIGVSGFYGWEPGGGGTLGSVNRTSEMDDFFGGSPVEQPRAWEIGNPYQHLDSASPSSFLLIAGEEDPLAADAACFHLALVDAGQTSRLLIVPRAGHLELISPRSPAGRTVVEGTLSALFEGEPRTGPEATDHCPAADTGSGSKD